MSAPEQQGPVPEQRLQPLQQQHAVVTTACTRMRFGRARTAGFRVTPDHVAVAGVAHLAPAVCDREPSPVGAARREIPNDFDPHHGRGWRLPPGQRRPIALADRCSRCGDATHAGDHVKSRFSALRKTLHSDRTTKRPFARHRRAGNSELPAHLARTANSCSIWPKRCRSRAILDGTCHRSDSFQVERGRFSARSQAS